MVCIDETAYQAVMSVLNAAGFLTALQIWDVVFIPKHRRQTKRLLWLVPVLLGGARLESALHSTGGANTASNGMESYLLLRHIGSDLLAWSVLALAFTWLRTTMQRTRPTSSSSPQARSTGTLGVLHTELEPAVQRFLNAADQVEIAAIATIYDVDFACVRVADAGGFVQLNREQMLAFFNRANDTASRQAAKAQPEDAHASVSVRETVVHHVEVVGDIGLVLLTRVKNIGNGWEPMFYSLIWRKQEGNWHLLREFVHQRTVPRW